MTKYGMQGAFFFCSAATTSGLATMPAPNHVYLLQRHGSKVLYVNPTFNLCAMKLREPNLKFEKRFLADYGKRSPESEGIMPSSYQRKIFPEFLSLNKRVQNLNNQKVSNPQITPNDSDAYYYWLIKQYVKVSNPIEVIDVCVFRDPCYNPTKYGLPMYCHNMLINMMGLEMDTILTTPELNFKLKHDQTNFDSFLLHRRELSEDEKKLGSYQCLTNWSDDIG